MANPPYSPILGVRQHDRKKMKIIEVEKIRDLLALKLFSNSNGIYGLCLTFFPLIIVAQLIILSLYTKCFPIKNIIKISSFKDEKNQEIPMNKKRISKS